MEHLAGQHQPLLHFGQHRYDAPHGVEYHGGRRRADRRGDYHRAALDWRRGFAEPAVAVIDPIYTIAHHAGCAMVFCRSVTAVSTDRGRGAAEGA